MEAKERALKAINAMKDMGISEKRAKPVLKKLFRLYDKNWEPIEADQYTALIDAIFEQDEEEATMKNEEEKLREETGGPPSKKMCLRGKADAASGSGELTLRKSKIEDYDLPIAQSDEHDPLLKMCSRGKADAASASDELTLRKSKIKNYDLPLAQSVEHDPLLSQVKDKDCQEALVLPLTIIRPDEEEESQLCLRNRFKHHPISPQSHSGDKGKDTMSASSICPGEEILQDTRQNVASHDPTSTQEQGCLKARPSFALRFKAPRIEPGIIISPKKRSAQRNDLMTPQSGTQGDYSPVEIPCVAKSPINSEQTVNNGVHSTLNGSSVQVKGVESLGPKDNHNGNSDRASEAVMNSEFVTVPETPMSFKIASSPLAEVKLSLSCSQFFRMPGVHMPCLDKVLKAVEDKCLTSYRILDPSFSIMKVFQETCQSFLDISSRQEKVQLPTSFSDGSSNGQPSVEAVLPEPSVETVLPEPSNMLLVDGSECQHNYQTDVNLKGGRNTKGQSNLTYLDNLIFLRQGFPVNDVRPPHDVNDISKGHERIRISVINEVNSEPYPSSFYYMRRNTVYHSAYLNFSLARIGDDCCSNCVGDCLSSSTPCVCVMHAGGDFAYTLDGLVKEEFLEECISMNRDPCRQHRHFCYRQCPKEEFTQPCKGHLVRKFIKECWSKCGCNKSCGNRVVQRGITCNLQVFFTSEEKGWGIRSLQNLSKGTFVCEYVGEVLTSTEICKRNMQSISNEKNRYSVLLDAAWGLEGVMKDEEALCLDGKYYGNVARFINHRCFDANLVGIPVKIETPDHHYYHLAFFATRDIDALEELTWDYGINFDGDQCSVKAFRCCCKSNYCRDLKRYRRTRFKRPALP